MAGAVQRSQQHTEAALTPPHPTVASACHRGPHARLGPAAAPSLCKPASHAPPCLSTSCSHYIKPGVLLPPCSDTPECCGDHRHVRQPCIKPSPQASRARCVWEAFYLWIRLFTAAVPRPSGCRIRTDSPEAVVPAWKGIHGRTRYFWHLETHFQEFSHPSSANSVHPRITIESRREEKR